MKNISKSRIFGFSLAIVSTVLATWLHLLAQPYLGDRVPFITFFPALFVTAIFSRLGPTLLAVALSSLAALYWFIPPENALLPEDAAAWTGMTLFILFGIGVALLSERMHRKSDQLKQERERFSVTIASIGDGVIVTDAAGRVSFLNSVAEQLIGRSLADVQRQPLESVFQIVHEQSRQPIGNPVTQALREARVIRATKDLVLIAKNGTEKAISASAAPIIQSNEELIGAVLVFRDVSQRRAAQMAAGRLAALVDSSEDAILGQTFEGVVTDWNFGAERLFGFAANEIIGQSVFSTIVAPEHKQELLQVLQRVQQGESGAQFETLRRCKDGRSIPVSVRISPIHDAAGKVIGASAIDRDISQQQAAERRRNARLAVTQIISQANSGEGAVSEILAAVCLALNWDVGCFWRIQPDEKSLRCQEFWQRPSRDLTAFRTATLQHCSGSGASLPCRVWESGQPLWIPDVVIDPPFDRALQAKENGLHGAFACPVTVGEKFLGAIECFSHEIQQPDDDLLEMMTTIGGQIGQFINRLEAEKKLRRSEQELSDFFDNAAIGLHWVGPDGTVLRVNQAELDLLGYTRDEYIGHHIAEFHADKPVIDNILLQLTSGELLHDFEARLRCKDGSIKHVLIDSNVLWEDGQFMHTRCFTRDVTERKLAEASLQESEERLRLALDAGRMGTWEWHIPTGEVIWSPTLEKVHGLKVGEFNGTFEAYQSDIHPDDRQRVLDTIRQTVSEGRAHHLEYRIIWPDGSLHWLEARGKLYRDDSGQPLRVIGVCSDISERKRLEQQLQQQLNELADAESRTRSVVDNVIDGIITIDAQGEVASFNPAAEWIFGYAANEVIGQNVRMLMPEPYHSEHDGYLANYLRTGEAKIIGIGRAVEGRRKNGSTFPLELAVSEFHWGNQRLFTGIVRDITERKNLEQSLRFLADASKSLSSLVDYKSTLQIVAQLAVPAFADWCTVDMLDANGSLERLAVAHEDPAKIRLAEELHHRYPPVANSQYGVMHVLRTGEAEVVTDVSEVLLEEAAQDEEHLRILRELNLTSYMCVPLRVKKRVLGVLSFVSDNASRRYKKADLAVAEDLAHRAAIAIDNALLYHQVREADRRKDEFLAMLAHELRNPLVPIRSGLDILSLDAGEHQETIQLMQAQVEHVVRLVDDLLDVSRIMRGKVELRIEPVQLATLVNQSVQAVRPLIDNRGQKLVISLPEEPIWLNADSVRLMQVIENLLNNASKYMDDGGRIDFTAQSVPNQVIIRVQDTGVGIEPELLPNVFELFTQSARSLDRSQGGLGIGLTLVQRLVELHAGTVSAFSDGLGHGSTFVVQLPTVSAPAQNEATFAPAFASQVRRILVVDDNHGSAWLLTKLLKKLGDYEVQTAHDGLSALAKVKEIHPEIVLLDIGLPLMDGYQCGMLIRQESRFDNVLLVALTGYGQAEDRRKSKEAGFDEHLVKPPSIDQLKAVLTHPKLTAARQY